MRFWDIRNADGGAKLYIYGEIAGDEWGKWTEDDKCPSDFVKALAGLSGKHIDFYINSPGGSVFGGMAIYNQLKRHQGGITAHVDGLAASIASVIMLAADTIEVPANASVMIHNPAMPMLGYYGEQELRSTADLLARLRDQIAGVYEARMAEPDSEWIRTLMEDEHWMMGAEVGELFTGVSNIAAVHAAALAHGVDWYVKAPDAVKAQGKPEIPLTPDDGLDLRIRLCVAQTSVNRRKDVLR